VKTQRAVLEMRQVRLYLLERIPSPFFSLETSWYIFLFLEFLELEYALILTLNVVYKWLAVATLTLTVQFKWLAVVILTLTVIFKWLAVVVLTLTVQFK